MKVHPRYHFVDVNLKKMYQKDESFILAQQTVQMYYTKYPSIKKNKADWMTVCKIKTRGVVDESKWIEIAYQPEEVVPVLEVVIDNQTYDVRDLNGLQIVVNLLIAHQQDAGISRTQAGQTNNEDEEDDEDNFDDYETNENEDEAA
ncbi:UNVERIFIED_CONTAM: hypothetical protein Sindi_0915600 [Sesamum indicum]